MSHLVLVVEDDADFRALVARMFEGWGHAVVTAGCVTDAVRVAARLRPDTVVTDVGLPDGDGFALAQRLTAMPWDPRVIIMSSDADAGHEGAAQRVGAVGFLCKDELFRGAIRRLVSP